MWGDTSREAAEVLRRRHLAMTPGERMKEGLRASVVARRVMRAGIRRRHPDYTGEHVELALAALLWGDNLFHAVYGVDPPAP